MARRDVGRAVRDDDGALGRRAAAGLELAVHALRAFRCCDRAPRPLALGAAELVVEPRSLDAHWSVASDAQNCATRRRRNNRQPSSCPPRRDVRSRSTGRLTPRVAPSKSASTSSSTRPSLNTHVSHQLTTAARVNEVSLPPAVTPRRSVGAAQTSIF